MSSLAATEKKDSTWVIPAHGRIDGGSLDGYNYAFLRLERTADDELDVLARVTPPDWPFPREAHIFASEPELLRRMPGARVPRVDLMAHAKRLLLEEVAS